ncbi:MAG: hydroxyacid dehydrogenase [Candidatus Omnitrophica bacterium]|nr:hydroxyacid dehydrogenase [Candidatus Omnitrophota bacterium]
MDVKFYEVFEHEEKAIRKYLPPEISAAFTWESIQESADKKPLAKVLCIRTQSKIPTEWNDKIEGILTRSQGYDHLEEYLRAVKIPIACAYLPEYCARAVAEHAIMAMFVLLKKTKQQIKNFDTFNRENITGQQCENRNLLVVGVGNIGREIVRLGHGLQMHVRGVDLEPRIEKLEYVSLEQGIIWADVVVCALPLTEKTKDLLNYEKLKGLKKGSVFINISRGEISPIKDIKRLLDEGFLAGVSLDVYPNEKDLARNLRAGTSNFEEDHKVIMELKDNNTVLFTPHNAFNTEESVEKKAELTAREIVSFVNSGKFINTITI